MKTKVVDVSTSPYTLGAQVKESLQTHNHPLPYRTIERDPTGN